jgi:drug/metabolite transporter (DMT)-like permease
VTLPALVWLLLASIWGSTWLFIKVGLEDLPPLTFAGLRFVVAAAPLVLWIAIRRVPLPTTWRDWRLMIVTGLLTFSLNYSLVFWGESHITSGLAAILYTTFPILGMLLAHAMLADEPLTARKLGGAALGLAGVVLIFAHELSVRGALALAGSAAIVVAALGTAYADVLIKREGVHIDPVVMTAVQMVVGLVPMLALGIALEGNPAHFAWTGRAVFALCYLALVGSSLTFTLLYWLIRRMQVTRMMLMPLWSTLVAVGLGVVVLDEQVGVRTVLGGAGILVGLLLAVSARRAAAATLAPAGPEPREEPSPAP